MAVAGPDRSGVAAGVPVPSSTTLAANGAAAAGGCPAPGSATTPKAATAAANTPVNRSLRLILGLGTRFYRGAARTDAAGISRAAPHRITERTGRWRPTRGLRL